MRLFVVGTELIWAESATQACVYFESRYGRRPNNTRTCAEVTLVPVYGSGKFAQHAEVLTIQVAERAAE